MKATRHGHWLVVVLWAAAVLAGCQQEGITGPPGEIGPPPPAKLPLHDFARRLGMAVTHASRSTATLRDPANTVVLYSDPDGQAYVNAAAVPASDGIEPAGGTLHVPADLLARIRSLLLPTGRRPEPARDERPDPPTRRRTESAGCVVIDPGHGGRDPGAISARGFREKNIVLTVSKLLAAELARRHVRVLLTRDDDRYLQLEDRPAVANRADADLFVSVHADAARNRSATGFTAYVSRSADAKSLAAAGTIVRRMRSVGARNRGVRRANYRVLVCADVPAVLIELGYLSNSWEAARLGNAGYQGRLARALASGIAEFLQGK